MRNEDFIRKINPALVLNDGRLKPFAEQLLEYEYGAYPNYLPFVISNTTMRLNESLTMPYPIIISQSTVEHIKKKHDVQNAMIMRIENMLRNNVLVMESRKHKEALVVVTDCLDKEDRPIVVIMRRDFRSGDVMTNSITSMYGKRDIQGLIEASFREGCEFYPNEKTEHWLTSQGLQLPPDVTTSVLSYHYNIPDTLYCQAESLYSRKNRNNGRHSSLDNQMSYAKVRASKKKKSKSSRTYKKSTKINR